MGTLLKSILIMPVIILITLVATQYILLVTQLYLMIKGMRG